MLNKKRALTGWIAVAIAAVGLGELAQPAAAKLQYSYAVKFVCGFNRSNVGMLSDGSWGGEATVKSGNYATEINIFNPSQENYLRKKVLFVVREDRPVGREPDYAPVTVEDWIILPNCTATMDDCNRIAELYYGGPAAVPTPLPLFIGFLVIESSYELDVTAVYTAEACSDWITVGGAAMCSSPPGIPGVAAFGVGISIDVEQIEGRKIPP